MSKTAHSFYKFYGLKNFTESILLPQKIYLPETSRKFYNVSSKTLTNYSAEK